MIGMGLIVVALCILTIPLYIYGKRLRAFYARHPALRQLGMTEKGGSL